MDMQDKIRTLALKLEEKNIDNKLLGYLVTLDSDQEYEFSHWFYGQIPGDINLKDIDSVTDEQFVSISEIFKSQEKYLEIAPWTKTKQETSIIDVGNAEPPQSKWDLYFIYGFSFFCALCVFGYIFCVTFFGADISETRLRFVDQSLGNMYAILNTVIGFYFGSAYTKAKADKNIITTTTTKTSSQKK